MRPRVPTLHAAHGNASGRRSAQTRRQAREGGAVVSRGLAVRVAGIVAGYRARQRQRARRRARIVLRGDVVTDALAPNAVVVALAHAHRARDVVSRPDRDVSAGRELSDLIAGAARVRRIAILHARQGTDRPIPVAADRAGVRVLPAASQAQEDQCDQQSLESNQHCQPGPPECRKLRPTHRQPA
jgi:hypothetical protein